MLNNNASNALQVAAQAIKDFERELVNMDKYLLVFLLQNEGRVHLPDRMTNNFVNLFQQGRLSVHVDSLDDRQGLTFQVVILRNGQWEPITEDERLSFIAKAS